VAPQTNEDLRATIAKHSSSHVAAISSIAEALSLKGVGLIPAKKIEANSLVGNLEIMRRISERVWTDEEKGRLQKFLGAVNFRRAHWGINHSTISRAVELLTTRRADPLSDAEYPAHAGQDLELYGNRVYQVLSFFGPTTFSLINRTGKAFPIPLTTERDVAMEKPAEGEDPPLTSIHAGVKKLSEAVKDMEEVLTKGHIRIEFKERAARYRNHVLTGRGRDELWKALKLHVAPQVDREAPPPDEGNGKKKRKQAKDDDFDEEEFFANLGKRTRA
jgi:hypothetical protein